MSHRRRARGKQCQVRAALALQAQLLGFDAGADRLIADAWGERALAREQRLAESLQCRWRGGVVAVAVDDPHAKALPASRTALPLSGIRLGWRILVDEAPLGKARTHAVDVQAQLAGLEARTHGRLLAHACLALLQRGRG